VKLNQRKILPETVILPPDFPYGKGGFEVSGGGSGPGIILMNPGPYRPLYVWGWHVRGVTNEPPLAWGEFYLAARWSPASSGTVR
jgi:hypothetical protein